MPELPEVETIKRIIGPQVKGQKILSVDVRNQQIIAHPATTMFTDELSGKSIQGMSRRGKFLSFDFVEGDNLYLHLRMTGQLLVTPKNFPMEKHTHLIMDLSGGKQIRYIDVRRFGRFWYLKKDEDLSVTGIDKLGIEPTSRELTAEYLRTAARKKKKLVREMLLDQTIVAGIGNIYSDEILYAAGIHPERVCIDLTNEEWKKLAEKIPEIILWGIKADEMTEEEFLAREGKEYRNIPYLKAYGHVGKACPKCGAIFEKVTVGGRSATFCPNCQRKITF